MKKRRLKKKVKRALIVFNIIVITIIGFIVYNKINHKNNSNIKKIVHKVTKKKNLTLKEQFSKDCKELDYCNEKYLDRYLKYYSKNKDLEFNDIVTRVNLNLDYDFYTNTKKTPYLNKDYILVNKYLYLDEDYIPDDLETIPEEYARSGMKLVSSAKDAFVEMARTARKNKTPIIAMSSFRSYKYQIDLYNKYAKSDGKEAADTYSARAGFSEHQTGLCVDIYDGKIDYTNFEKSKSFDWMEENSYKYGYILRFPKGKENITGYQYESWHYRYVGKDIAKYIHDNDITFDEYYVQKIENKY